MRLWIVDYLNPHTDSVDCLVIEADSRLNAHDKAVTELKILKIPQRYILKLEEF